MPIKKCIFKTPDGKRLVVDRGLKGRIQCYCRDVENKCGVVINKVAGNDEGNWSCRMKIEDKNGKTKTKKKNINLALEEENYDDDEYYDDDHHYDHHHHNHYHYKTSTTTTTTTTTSICPSPEWKEFQNHCYILLEHYFSMQNCSEECKRMGGNLASIHSKEENDVVADLIKPKRLYHLTFFGAFLPTEKMP